MKEVLERLEVCQSSEQAIPGCSTIYLFQPNKGGMDWANEYMYTRNMSVHDVFHVKLWPCKEREIITYRSIAIAAIVPIAVIPVNRNDKN